MGERPDVNLRDPGQAGLLIVGALMLVATPVCASMAALRAGLPLLAVGIPVVVLLAGAAVARIARSASPPPRGSKP